MWIRSRDHHRIRLHGADWRGEHVFGDRIDAVIIGSVPLMLDLIDLGRDHEDFFEVWAVASEKNGRRVERLRHEAQP